MTRALTIGVSLLLLLFVPGCDQDQSGTLGPEPPEDVQEERQDDSGVESGTSTLATVAYTGNYQDLLNLPELFDGHYDSLAGGPALSAVAMSGDYRDLINRPEAAGDEQEAMGPRPVTGVVSQTIQSLRNNGPQGAYIVLDWSGTSNAVIRSMANGVVPLGQPFLIEVSRTIADSGGPGGHGPEALGRYVEFHHGDGIIAAANGNLSYRATPNANDWRGDNAALFELLELVRVGEGQFILTRLPEPRSGYTHGDPQHVPGTTSRTGFAWERRADGTAHLTNGTVRIPAYGIGGSEPRFRYELSWPFRFEQHHGNHRTVQMGISTKSTNAHWSALSVPRNSSTDRAGMIVTVYVAPGSQSQVRTGDYVSVTIMASGNWRLPSDQW